MYPKKNHTTNRLFSTALLTLAAFSFAVSTADGQPVYNYTRIHVEQVQYQESDPSASWGINQDYLVFLPDDYSAEADPYPVLFFLHGAGSRGADLVKVSNLPPMLQAENGNQNFPFVVIAPQNLATAPGWRNEALQAELMTFFEETVELYNIDRNRIYLTGQSMGGGGTWDLLVNYPDYFAAAVPICGANEVAMAASLVNIPIWAFHGRLDRTILPDTSIDMVNAIVAAGGSNVRLNIYEEIGHEVWWTVFKRPDIYDWFLRHSKGEAPPLMWGEHFVGPDGSVDTGDWLGLLQVERDPWVWAADIQSWLYYPESHSTSTSGKWIYSARF